MTAATVPFPFAECCHARIHRSPAKAATDARSQDVAAPPLAAVVGARSPFTGRGRPDVGHAARFAEYREHVKHLTDDQKWELGAPAREKQKAEMDRYFAMSEAERTRYLDEQIDRSEKMRQAWKQKAAQGKGSQGKGGQAKGRLSGGGFGPGGKGSATQAGGEKGKRTPRSTEEILQRRKQHLDRTSPEERARIDKFRKDMADRRKQRGLPPRSRSG
jgi:hypothetical protein